MKIKIPVTDVYTVMANNGKTFLEVNVENDDAAHDLAKFILSNLFPEGETFSAAEGAVPVRIARGSRLTNIRFDRAHNCIRYRVVPRKPMLKPVELVAGWQGPQGFRVIRHRTGPARCCFCWNEIKHDTICMTWNIPKAGGLMPESVVFDRRFAHCECLHLNALNRREEARNGRLRVGPHKANGISFDPADVPEVYAKNILELDRFVQALGTEEYVKIMFDEPCGGE